MVYEISLSLLTVVCYTWALGTRFPGMFLSSRAYTYITVYKAKDNLVISCLFFPLSQTANLPHQILGILVCIAVGVNVSQLVYCSHTTQVVTKCSSACWKCLLNNIHDCIIIGTNCCSLVERTSCACKYYCVQLSKGMHDTA